jgi:ABC-2 type transport system permease protein
VILGLVFGNIASNIDGFLGSASAIEMIQKLGGVKALTDAFMSTELGMVAIGASAYAIQAVMRLRAEETELRAEPVLATGVKRLTWVWSHLTIAVLGAGALMLAVGLGAGLTYSAETGSAADFWRVLGAALVRVPAAWVLAGLVVAAFGLAPRAAVAGWAALVAFLLLGEFGPLFELNQYAMDLSPYAHVPRLPGGEFSVVPLLGLAAVAAALVAVGLVGFRRRDVPIS